jgi:signal transduction histidine kinase
LQASTAEQQEVSKVIAAIHEKYIGEINGMLLDERYRKHFLSQWIHNMKTPASVIDLIIQSISENSEPLDKRIEDIREENYKILNGLEQVLNINRLDDFAKDYMPVAIDLVSSVNMVINEKKGQFIYNNVFPRFQQSTESIYVLSDAKWNQFMLEQIVSNAIKYSAFAGQSKNVYFRINSQSDQAVLTIEDEGVGIPEYDIPRIFEPFFTGENGRRYKNSTGIGLFICKTIAEKLGHQINIESRVGQGTKVSISYLSKM